MSNVLSTAVAQVSKALAAYDSAKTRQAKLGEEVKSITAQIAEAITPALNHMGFSPDMNSAQMAEARNNSPDFNNFREAILTEVSTARKYKIVQNDKGKTVFSDAARKLWSEAMALYRKESLADKSKQAREAKKAKLSASVSKAKLFDAVALSFPDGPEAVYSAMKRALLAMQAGQDVIEKA